MQLSSILITCFLGCVLLLDNDVSGQKIEFPVETCVTGILTGNYLPCAAELASSIFELYQWSENTPINICGISCTGNLKGRFRKFKWVWDGRFRCDSKAPGVVGKDTRPGRTGAMEWAIKDFLNKAIASGQIKAEEFNC